MRKKNQSIWLDTQTVVNAWIHDDDNKEHDLLIGRDKPPGILSNSLNCEGQKKERNQKQQHYIVLLLSSQLRFIAA